MKTLAKWLAVGSSMALLFFIVSCNKENSSASNSGIPSGESKVSVFLTDAPVSFYKVLIDIRQVAVEIDTATSQGSQDISGQWDDGYCGFDRDAHNKSVVWDTLNITPGVYNLLDLRNGTDTLLGSGLYSSGKILKVKITLGSADTVYTDSSTYYPLAIFGPSPSFTINVQRENISTVTNNEFQLWLDFNLERSVFFWNGRFMLNPYIVVFNYKSSAKIKGQVLPPGASPLVTAYSAKDTLYAIPGWNGNYQFSNVPVGTYSINFKGHNGFQDTTINDIEIDTLKQVKIPLVTLRK
ncbi:MAG: DUF4382 domain-containing protein [Bacteroidota bacterium]|nr:DUF4382 domain-containing protein [Bacteroidota bacterium]MDP4211833.1 DUF4382 domain-containing protein [Bacteroidota bacterium]MDP4250959.1 DUF4382 domain-containing protein [Bacteroidota bacterium]